MRTAARTSGHRSSRGFTLVELLVALTLFALLSGVLFGGLRLAGRSWDSGETRVMQVSEMRQTTQFLRGQLTALYPQRMRKAAEFPLWFAGTGDDLRYTAALPERVVDGGVLYFHLYLQRDGDRGRLMLERMTPDLDALRLPEFDADADRTILADHIASLKIAYFGRERDSADTETPTWRDRWDDPQRVPMLIRIEVTPERAAPWPPLLVEPRRSPEAGCRAWDPVRQRCVRP